MFLIGLFAVLFSQQPAAVLTGTARCEAMLRESAPEILRNLNAAACFDDEWQFKRAAELLTEAVKLLQAEATAGKEGPLPGTAQAFAGAAIPLPERTNNPAAAYPGALALQGVKGVVVTEVVVDRDGRVRNARVVESVRELDQLALELVRQFRFQQTKVQGNPADVAMFVPIRYGLPSAQTPGDRARLAAIYYREQRIAVASQTAAIALYHANRDVTRFGAVARAPGDVTPETKPVADPTQVVKEPTRVKFVDPAYPPYAIKAGVTGRVVISAMIDTNGAVGRARIKEGINGLDASALDAVMQWQYTPTLLNGNPVTVLMTAFVNYNIKR